MVKIPKPIPPPTSTMVLKIFWTDIEWGEHGYNHFLSPFREVDGIVVVILVKSAFPPVELG
jgi:hypothetical protein